MAVVVVYLMNLGIHFENLDSLSAPVPGLLVSLGVCVGLVHEGLEITLVLDGQKSRLEVLSQGHIVVVVSTDLWLSAYSTHWGGNGPFPKIFWLVADPLSFFSAVFLAPPVFLSVLYFVSNSPLWIFFNTGWEFPDVGWLSLSCIPVVSIKLFL